MKTNSTSNNILVLTDFSEASNIALRNAAKMVKLINGNIYVYHAHNIELPSVEQNQLTFNGRLREINRQTFVKAKEIISSIEKEQGINIEFTMDHGNIKNCISKKVREINPDLVILGRRKSKFLDFLGDKVTQFVIDHCDTSVLISGGNHELHSFSNLSLGFFGDTIEKSEFQIIEHLQESPRSIKYFGIRSRMPSAETTDAEQKTTTSYVFSQDGSKAIDALTSYVARTNTELFCIPKNNNTKLQPVKEMVNRLEIPILLYK
tara:strand:- start:2689 stop:3477 length:789 start_codon:yes stop_codon:yes gene_type:complete